MAAAATLLLPALASAKTSSSMGGPSDVGALSGGGTVGFQTGNGATQFRLSGEGQYGLMMLAPQLELDFAGHVALMFGDFTNVEILPEARFRYLMDRKLSLYGDGGFGVAFASGNGASQTWAVLRFAGGVQYKIDQNLSFLGEPVALNFYLGDGGGFQYGLAAGVLYKF